MPRTKTIELDGAAFVIAPLTVAQVEQYLGTPVDEKMKMLGTLIPRSTYELIAASFVNAGLGEWTPEMVRNQLDLDTVDRLFEEVLKFSRMRLEKKPGEAQPAMASTSPEPLPNSLQ